MMVVARFSTACVGHIALDDNQSGLLVGTDLGTVLIRIAHRPKAARILKRNEIEFRQSPVSRNNFRSDSSWVCVTVNKRLRFKKFLSHCSPATEPSKGNFAVFLNDRGEVNYTGIITDWPMIVTADIELGEAKELDATKAPFADKTIKYFSVVRDN